MNFHRQDCRGALAALIAGLWLAILLVSAPAIGAAEFYQRKPTWAETMQATREALLAGGLSAESQGRAAAAAWFRMQEDFPVAWDWTLQDVGTGFPEWFSLPTTTQLEWQAIDRALTDLRDAAGPFHRRLNELRNAKVPGSDTRWLELYYAVCEKRRELRLSGLLAQTRQIVFTKHRTLRPSFFAYTEGQSDAQNERNFAGRAELCLLEFEGKYGQARTLLADRQGAIRDPALSWDAQRVAFAWKKSLDHDDYHIYELDLASAKVRQITSGKGFADYEPAYLPDGDLVFASTRCVQTVDCWWTEVSNLYRCGPDGLRLRRLGFDQVHAIYPQVLDDGRFVYTRWDYNDRGQIFPQPLFQMNPDGTGQTEFYGNSSWFPTTIAHARGIPGTQKVLAILCGHHSSQAGKLAVIDPRRGRQENQGVQLVAPLRDTPADRIDGYGQEGDLWQYPYPINDRECIATYAPLGWDRPARRRGDADFGIYWMDFDGRRELLAWDAVLPCNQPVPVIARRTQAAPATRVDWRRAEGTVYVQDIYSGHGLEGVRRGAIKKLRVVALDFRAAGVGSNGSEGPGGAALVSTPVSIGNGSWDVKVVLGEAKVFDDGSALFSVPARTPVYFQAIDENGYAAQTMRSWSTLQPGEFAGCTGCHENKNSAPAAARYTSTQALRGGIQSLEPFYGPPRGFSFSKEIQPILDRHCIGCHSDREPLQRYLSGHSSVPVLARARSSTTGVPGATNAFTLLGNDTIDQTAKRKWSDSYLVLTEATRDRHGEAVGAFRGNAHGRTVNWISSQSVPEPLPPYFAGAAKSKLMALLSQGHNGLHLSREELAKFACWIDLLVPYCGDYTEANAWDEEEGRKYAHFLAKRRASEELEQAGVRQILARESVVPGG